MKKCILFCENHYAFGILAPIKTELKNKGYDVLWYISEKLKHKFPFEEENHTSSIDELKDYKSDVIFVPGNEVPHFLRGIKVQVFHGLAGEKKGHFRIRHYFDLYLTQGPLFTKKFKELALKYKNFKVKETGWSKLDVYATDLDLYKNEKAVLLKEHQAENIILYAPTFSPSLTSANSLVKELGELAKDKKKLILIKFHDLMDPKTIDLYHKLASTITNIVFVTDRNIVKYLLISDLMISDTSSVVYEFILLNKPVITLNTRNPKEAWQNILKESDLVKSVETNLTLDPFATKRADIITEYHPYSDGKSSARMVDAVEESILKNGVPTKRKLSFFRKYKINKKYR
jgi:CDP-ribitol ribitolphosphotransferase